MVRHLEKLSSIVLSIVFILNMGTVYFALYYNQFAMGSIVILLCILIVNMLHYQIRIPADVFVMAIFYGLYFIPYAILSNVGSGILLFCAMIPLITLLYFCYIKSDKLRELLEIFVNCVLAIGVVSTFFWLTGSLFHLISPTGTVPLMWTGEKALVRSYYYLYFEPQANHLKILGFWLTMKNCGIFSEAPMASFAYSTALIANAYLKPEKHTKDYILMFFIVTTQSTTGIIIMISYLLFLIYSRKNRNNWELFIKVAVSLLITIIGLYVGYKLIQMKLASGSGKVRSGKFVEEFNAFIQSPLYGNGFNTFTNGSSNSITSILADGGIMLFGFYYLPVIVSIVRYWRNKYIVFLLVLCLMMVSITCVITSYIMTAFTVFLWLNLLNRGKNRTNQSINFDSVNVNTRFSLKGIK